MNRPEVRSIQANGRPIHYQLNRSDRKTLSISVEPDRRVVVTAPVSASDELVDARVRRRALWIRRQQKHFESLPPPAVARLWVSGETHRYLGRQYRLKVVAADKPEVRLMGKYFLVSIPDRADRNAVQRAMTAWYREHALPLFALRLDRLLAATTWLSLREAPKLTIRTMRLRWGSTSPTGRICLNLELAKLPMGCIDYVIAHELAHLKEPNHGASFWRLLGRLYPDWEHWRFRLTQQES